jgi:hypothetical protein
VPLTASKQITHENEHTSAWAGASAGTVTDSMVGGSFTKAHLHDMRQACNIGCLSSCGDQLPHCGLGVFIHGSPHIIPIVAHLP